MVSSERISEPDVPHPASQRIANELLKKLAASS